MVVVRRQTIPMNRAARRHPDSYLLTTAETSDILAISRSKLFALIKSGELPSCKVGRCRRISRITLDEFIDSLAENGGTA